MMIMTLQSCLRFAMMHNCVITCLVTSLPQCFSGRICLLTVESEAVRLIKMSLRILNVGYEILGYDILGYGWRFVIV